MKKNDAERKKIALAGVSAIIALIIFAVIAADILGGFYLKNIDEKINEKMTRIQKSRLTNVMITITEIASPLRLLVATIIIGATIAYQRKGYRLSVFITSLMLGLIMEFALKQAIPRARPENALTFINQYSFPSGHALIATIFFMCLIHAFKDDFDNKQKKYAFIIAAIGAIALVGFTRVYLNVHWFSDVIAGCVLGIACVSIALASIKPIRKTIKKRTNPSSQS